MTKKTNVLPFRKPKKCGKGDCVCTIVIVGTVFTIYRCEKCGAEEWL